MRNVLIPISILFLVGCGTYNRPPPAGFVESSHGFFADKEAIALFDDLFTLAVKIAGDRGLDTDKMSTSVKGWDFIWEPADDEGTFYSPEHNISVYGYTDCMYREMHIGKPTEYFGSACTSAFYHELLHIYEGCADGDHVGWKEKGYYEDEATWMYDCIVKYGWSKR